MNFLTFTLEEQRKIIGHDIGTSDWVEITQDMITMFGKVTLDPDPMHIDPDWSNMHSPFEQTVAFGFQTISMLTHLFHNVLGAFDHKGTADTSGYPLNYGFDYLRLTHHVPVRSRIRGHFTLKDVSERNEGELLQTVHCEIEVENEEKPALVADWLFVWVTQLGHQRISLKSC